MKVVFGKEGTVTPVEPAPSGVVEITGVGGDPSPAAAPMGPPPPEPAVAVPATVPAPPPVPAPRGAINVDDDRILMADLKIPSLNIVQGVGDLCKAFTAGEIVFDKKHVLAKAPPKNPKTDAAQTPIRMVVLGFRPTRYAEKIDGGEQGRILATLSDVERAGGTTVWNEAYSGRGKERVQNKPYFQPLASALILIAAPEGVTKLGEDDVDVVFPLALEVDGKVVNRFAMAFWHLRGTAHTAVARPLKTHRISGVLRCADGYKSRWLEIGTEYKPYDDGHGAFLPTYRIAGPTEPRIRELAADVLRSLTAAE